VKAAGSSDYPLARRLLITADAGGSNGYRTRAWKAELAAQTGLEITCCHFPPGTSTWNKVEHRLFSRITMNWRGRPLTSHEVIVQTIAATTTRTGLRVRAELDTSAYDTRIKVSDRQMDALPLTRHDWHGDRNYTLRPEAYDQAAGAPDPFDRPGPAPSTPPAPPAARSSAQIFDECYILPALSGILSHPPTERPFKCHSQRCGRGTGGACDRLRSSKAALGISTLPRHELDPPGEALTTRHWVPCGPTVHRCCFFSSERLPDPGGQGHDRNGAAVTAVPVRFTAE
jgi:Rhodopirellula transposase DDE domain